MRVSSRRDTRHHDDSMIGVSDWIQQIRDEIRRVAPYDSGVLITGPTGTGKELISRSIHLASARAEGPFVPVDCAALGGELFASHMFGHVKGAFTGAHYAAMGAFRAADSCGSFKKRPWFRSAATKDSPSTCGSLPRPIATCRKKFAVGGSARICFTVSTSFRSRRCPSASARKTSKCSPVTSSTA